MTSDIRNSPCRYHLFGFMYRPRASVVPGLLPADLERKRLDEPSENLIDMLILQDQHIRRCLRRAEFGARQQYG
jgi:hypothetical protein